MTSIIQNTTPMEAVKSFIGFIKTKDLDSMRRLSHPNATACLIRENKPQFSTLSESMDVLKNAEQQFVEATWDEVEHVDGDYANVRLKFSMHRDGKLLQTGTSSYSCWRSPDSGWVILTMSDIARAASDDDKA